MDKPTIEWENLCNNCGKCCAMFNTNIACPLYDTVNNRCSNYEKRFDHIPDCDQLTPDNVMHYNEVGVLPNDCNYVLYLQGKELVWPEPTKLTPYSEAPLHFRVNYELNKGKLKRR